MDDTLLNLRLLEDILSDQGYRVLALPRGDLALRAAKRHPPDLVGSSSSRMGTLGTGSLRAGAIRVWC